MAAIVAITPARARSAVAQNIRRGGFTVPVAANPERSPNPMEATVKNQKMLLNLSQVDGVILPIFDVTPIRFLANTNNMGVPHIFVGMVNLAMNCHLFNLFF